MSHEAGHATHGGSVAPEIPPGHRQLADVAARDTSAATASAGGGSLGPGQGSDGRLLPAFSGEAHPDERAASGMHALSDDEIGNRIASRLAAAADASHATEGRPGDDATAQTFAGPIEAGAEHGASGFVDEGAGDPVGLSPSEVLALAEEYRLLALAELDHLGAAVSTAVAAMRWNGGNSQRIADTLTLASHHLAEALDFESGRIRLLRGEPQPEPAPAEHQAPAEAPSSILDDVSARAAEEHRQRALKALVDTIEWGHRVIKTLQDNSADPRPAVDAMSWFSLAGGVALEAVNSRAAALSGSGPETPAAPAPAPSFPPESHLVAATRSLEAVKSHADQALMGLQFAPHEHGVMIDVMQGLRRHAEASAQAHLNYAAAQITAAG